MTMYGKFDTDTQALKERLSVNTQHAAVDLQSWVLSQLDLFDGMRVLDIGCGTGKYLAAIGEMVEGAKLTGLDYSEAAIQQCPPAVTGLRQSFDDEIAGEYDLILAVYSIYYSKDMISLIERLKNNLSKGGFLFLVGPGEGTNQEVVRDLGLSWQIPDFLNLTDTHYPYSEVMRLNNKITFPDKQSFLNWWTNHNSYNESLLPRVESRVFTFFLSNNGLGGFF
jgi:SAM-dependent methyltransferase